MPAKTVYAFPTRARCPSSSCRSLNTERRAASGRVQYRLCRDCGCSFNVVGAPA